MHKITNLWKFELDWSSELQDNYERKTKLVTGSCVLWMLDFENSISKLEVSKSNSWKITSFSKNYVTLEGAISHYVLYYQPLPITRYQLRFMLMIVLSNYQYCPLPFKELNGPKNPRYTFPLNDHILKSAHLSSEGNHSHMWIHEVLQPPCFSMWCIISLPY